MKTKILISACLMGENVKYDGGNNLLHVKIIERWKKEGRLVLACPEVLGGLSTPRPPCEVVCGSGHVVNCEGEDVTKAFVKGAEETLKIAHENGVVMAILKARSPSCGKDVIYDGTFSHTHVRDSGFTCKALHKAGIIVFSEEELEAAEAFLKRNEV